METLLASNFFPDNFWWGVGGTILAGLLLILGSFVITHRCDGSGLWVVCGLFCGSLLGVKWLGGLGAFPGAVGGAIAVCLWFSLIWMWNRWCAWSSTRAASRRQHKNSAPHTN